MVSSMAADDLATQIQLVYLIIILYLTSAHLIVTINVEIVQMFAIISLK